MEGRWGERRNSRDKRSVYLKTKRSCIGKKSYYILRVSRNIRHDPVFSIRKKGSHRNLNIQKTVAIHMATDADI